jgi:autotransporter-associated beta strand protein
LGASVALPAGPAPTFVVNSASDSTRVQGLTFSGLISGGAAGATVLTKSGLGTLALSNTANSFSGILEVQNGVLSANGAGALGAANNTVLLNPAQGLTATLRMTADATLDATTAGLRFGGLSGGDIRRIEVAAGRTLTLGAAVDVTAAPAAPLVKAGSFAGFTPPAPLKRVVPMERL